jgi:hypothetical protein
MRLRLMTWKRRIKRGEKVGLELSPEERKLLLTGLVFLHREVEMAIRSAPPGGEVMLTLSDLDDLAGHVAGRPTTPRTNGPGTSSAKSSTRSKGCSTSMYRRDSWWIQPRRT